MTDQSQSDQGVPPVDVPEAGVPGLILPDPPSKAKLVWATLAALGVAGVVLVSAILPAEYDIDPLGIGEVLGLRVLSNPGDGTIAVRPDGIAAQLGRAHV